MVSSSNLYRAWTNGSLGSCKIREDASRLLKRSYSHYIVSWAVSIHPLRDKAEGKSNEVISSMRKCRRKTDEMAGFKLAATDRLRNKRHFLGHGVCMSKDACRFVRKHRDV